MTTDTRIEQANRGQALSKSRVGRVLVVCTGNICRSPTAEIVLRAKSKGTQTQIESAGLAAAVRLDMCPIAAEILRENGHIDFEEAGHRPRQLDGPMLHRADLVLAMERAQLQWIVTTFPETRGKVFLMSQWNGGQDIADPYRQSEEMYRHVFALIERAAESWSRHF
ncbi:protein-tyrosine phosphatase [Paraburkholderia sp. GAS199]|uniref:low molecular weight protein-tyrosine-phosphatase n=1 Tax=Paraburkholderia sp. GAS199 TaxID=3035126 RepID=UPI003D20A5E7